MDISKFNTRWLLFFLLTVLLSLKTRSQNLVANGDFEKNNYIFFMRPLLFLSSWKNPSSAQPRVVSKETSYFGNQKARTGKSYVSLEYSYLKISNNNFGELYYISYVQVKLTKKLKKDSLYCLKLFTSLADNYEYAIENMEAGFSNTKIKTYHNKLYIEPDYSFKLFNPELILSNKDTWVENCACIKATGKERYLQIGYFSKDIKLYQVSEHKPKFLATNYFIDDVSLTPINHIDSCDCTRKPSVQIISDYLIETFDTSQNNGYSLEIKDLHYNPNASSFDSTYKSYLTSILNYLVLYPNKKIIIESYCFPNEFKGRSCDLAKLRVENLATYFILRGISQERIVSNTRNMEIPSNQNYSDKKEFENIVNISIRNP